MQTLKKQQGVTGIGWLIILGLIAFFVLIGLRLFPIYIEKFSVVSSLESLKNEPQVTKKPKAEILRLITNRFQINDVKNATRKDITITQRGGVLTVSVKYDVKTKLFGPLSLIAEFDESVEVIGN
ncbi:DUF4845 domain-containing protein [Sulfuriflexus mobilis]|uniref:DUF4845 domain-containing protein n=1 Tax=Sulfuriflexus mobilis TaxID=1811807 RepID=UPI001559C637|nr:DUF4845 domain-containing protein [Sulfuriflexus mobilis]